MLNRRFATVWRLLSSGEFIEFFLRSFRFLKKSKSKQPKISYSEWRENYLNLNEEQRNIFNKKLVTFVSRPSFGLFLRVDDTDLSSVFSCIESVRNQIYPDWVLYITSESKLDSDFAKKVSSLRDSRIKLEVSNSVLPEDWITEFDSKVKIHEAALLTTAFAIAENPEVSLIYTDHDHLDPQGNFCDPYMKPDWNAELFASTDYLSPLVFIEKNLWENNHDNNSERHDFLQNVIEDLSPSAIFHIPNVLASVLVGSDSSHLEPSVKKIKRDVPNPIPLVSILIPTRNQGRILKKCLESLFNKTTYSNFEVILIDHETHQSKALKVIKEFEMKENFTVTGFSGAFNFAAMINRGAEIANGEILLLLNNDTEVFDSDWLTELVSQVSRPEVGIAGSLLLFGDETVQHAGIHPGLGGLMGHGHKHVKGSSSGYFNRLKTVHEVAAVTGACLAIENKTWNEVGGLDEQNLAVAYNDVDLCLKVRRMGLKVIFTPFSIIFHHESISRGSDDNPEKNRRLRGEIEVMQERWGEELNEDPAYSVNHSSDGGGFLLEAAPDNRFLFQKD